MYSSAFSQGGAQRWIVGQSQVVSQPDKAGAIGHRSYSLPGRAEDSAVAANSRICANRCELVRPVVLDFIMRRVRVWRLRGGQAFRAQASEPSVRQRT